MPLFTVTLADRTLQVRAACRSCARNVAVEHITARGEPTVPWRDPEQARVKYIGPSEPGAQMVLTDSAVV